ncbi:LuxR C-terminal-related transcriptional regulator [Streptomyces sp. NPDC050145]|uniref:LuxR C-terminal-related transcriptional regulator n=1 Tax=Streptomyces sp. NPDC050145 TaxID=3365602 RepID=UPI0037944A85
MASPSASSPRAVPADLTSFVGRRDDLAAVRQLFSASRLVTLTGMGGVGKTRLALQAGHTMRRAFPDGVYLVELASLTDPDLLPQTVRDAIGLREQPAVDPLGALEDFLGKRRLLLVLDNCEHLVDATADLVDRVLRAAPEVKVLVTSRQALRTVGEHIYPVAPLRTPEPDALQSGTAKRYPAVALFADRAAAVLPGFTITERNEAAVVRLCRRLEGIPLAIELACVRLRALTVDELASRLDDRFELLREGSRNLPERHQTLRALIDWSYDLCTPVEQLLWARASVFAGGFTTDALEGVCTDERLPVAAVLDTVARLVDKSILIRGEHAGHTRFGMLETLREYGRARLAEAAEAADTARRHRDRYAELIATAGREWAGPLQEEWATCLQLEHANIRQALEYCMSVPGEAATGLRMAAVPWFWGAMDHLTEARLWLDRGLALHREPTHERVWALATTAYIAGFQGDDDASATHADLAHELAAGLDDRARAYADHVRGFRRSLGGTADLASAVPLLTEALAEYTASGMEAQYAESLMVELGASLLMLGDHEHARSVADELRERCAARGERWNLSYAHWLRGILTLFDGDPERAEQELFEALRIKQVFRDTLGLGLTLESVAWTAAVRGEAERAALLFGATDEIWRTLGARQMRAFRKRYEAMARERVGDARFEVARERGSRLGVDEVIAVALRESADDESPEPPAPATRLTPREQQVARLVAEGLSNKEIAARLVISLRTAEGHVERILSKQGFTSRAQIAIWLTQQAAQG